MTKTIILLSAIIVIALSSCNVQKEEKYHKIAVTNLNCTMYGISVTPSNKLYVIEDDKNLQDYIKYLEDDPYNHIGKTKNNKDSIYTYTKELKLRSLSNLVKRDDRYKKTDNYTDNDTLFFNTKANALIFVVKFPDSPIYHVCRPEINSDTTFIYKFTHSISICSLTYSSLLMNLTNIKIAE